MSDFKPCNSASMTLVIVDNEIEIIISGKPEDRAYQYLEQMGILLKGIVCAAD